jgi:hypothetical protein
LVIVVTVISKERDRCDDDHQWHLAAMRMGRTLMRMGRALIGLLTKWFNTQTIRP